MSSFPFFLCMCLFLFLFASSFFSCFFLLLLDYCCFFQFLLVVMVVVMVVAMVVARIRRQTDSGTTVVAHMIQHSTFLSRPPHGRVHGPDDTYDVNRESPRVRLRLIGVQCRAPRRPRFSYAPLLSLFSQPCPAPQELRTA